MAAKKKTAKATKKTTKKSSKKVAKKAVKKTVKKPAKKSTQAAKPTKTQVPRPAPKSKPYLLIAFVVIVAAILIAIFANQSAPQADEIAQTQPVIPTAQNDPAFTLYAIDDPDCSICETATIANITKQEIFPTAQVALLDKNDPQAQDLIRQLNLNFLPAFIMESAVENTANYARIEPALERVGTYYMFRQGYTGPYKLQFDIDVSSRPMQGDANAPITLIEFSDFECPYCKQFTNEIKPEIQSYIDNGDVEFVFMHYPINSDDSYTAAIAAECANMQGQFWDFHNRAFASNDVSEQSLQSIAQSIGLDMPTYNQCVTQQETASIVDAQLALARELELSGTPSFIMNGIPFVGALPAEIFTQIIELELGN